MKDDKLMNAIVNAQAKEAGWPNPEREVRVSPTRRFRLDYAWLGNRIALEIEGGVFMRGKSAHSSGTGILRDMEKQNHCVINGWRVLRMTPSQVRAGELTGWLQAIEAEYKAKLKT